MELQKVALLVIIVLSVLEIASNALRDKRKDRTRLKILIKARDNPYLVEGLVRCVVWELSFLRGLDVEVGLEIDSSCTMYRETHALGAILIEEGLVGPVFRESSGFEPDLVFVV